MTANRTWIAPVARFGLMRSRSRTRRRFSAAKARSTGARSLATAEFTLRSQPLCPLAWWPLDRGAHGMVGALVAGVRGDLHTGGVGCLDDAVGAGGGQVVDFTGRAWPRNSSLPRRRRPGPVGGGPGGQEVHAFVDVVPGGGGVSGPGRPSRRAKWAPRRANVSPLATTPATSPPARARTASTRGAPGLTPPGAGQVLRPRGGMPAPTAS